MANERERRTMAEREARLADALRANLRRRKVQARAAATEGAIDGPALPESPESVAGKIDDAT